MLILISFIHLLLITQSSVQQDQLFPLLNFNFFGGQQSNYDIADHRLKRCCGRLNEADAHCKSNFCSFDAINSNNVSYFTTNQDNYADILANFFHWKGKILAYKNNMI